MNLYSASATCDWGTILHDEKIKAGKWSTAFNRAGYMAQTRARRRPARITISLVRVGKITVNSDNRKVDSAAYLGLPEDKDTPEKPI